MLPVREIAPVIVVGAGPVGMATALMLAGWSIPVVVLESKAGLDDIGSKAICMQRDVLDIFDRIGCAEPMMAEGVTWNVGRTYYRDHELFVTSLPDSGRSAFPWFINIAQTSTERYLLERVQATPLIDVRWGCQVTGVQQDADSAWVTYDSPAGPQTAAGQYVVGCDGSRSRVRRLLGLDFPGHSFDDQFLICDVRAKVDLGTERRFYFDPPWNPGRQVLVHPQPDDVWRIDWQVPGDFDLEAERASGALEVRIRQIIGATTPYEIVWASQYRFHERMASAFAVNRVFLAGDSAHIVSPFGARGLNSGMQDAENLAWKLAFVLQGWAPKALLDTYAEERRAAAEENIRVTEATMRFLVPRDDVELTHRRASLEAAVTDPAARERIDSGKLAEPFWYIDSSLTAPDGDLTDFPRQAGQLRPPVPGVLCPDGPIRLPAEPHVRRLRQLVGQGFLVLASRGVDLEGLREAATAATGAPVRVLCLDEIDTEGVLSAALDARAGHAFLLRPDGHLAAIVDAADASTLTAAVRRASGAPASR